MQVKYFTYTWKWPAALEISVEKVKHTRHYNLGIGWDHAECGLDLAECGWDLDERFEAWAFDC